jgi:hypothetical protein
MYSAAWAFRAIRWIKALDIYIYVCVCVCVCVFASLSVYVIIYSTTDRLRGYLKGVPDPLSECRHDMIDALLKSNLFLWKYLLLLCWITVIITDKLFSISSAKKDNPVVTHGGRDWDSAVVSGIACWYVNNTGRYVVEIVLCRRSWELAWTESRSVFKTLVEIVFVILFCWCPLWLIKLLNVILISHYQPAPEEGALDIIFESSEKSIDPLNF